MLLVYEQDIGAGCLGDILRGCRLLGVSCGPRLCYNFGMTKILSKLPFYGLGLGFLSLIPNLDGELFMPLWFSLPLIAISGFAEWRMRKRA